MSCKCDQHFYEIFAHFPISYSSFINVYWNWNGFLFKPKSDAELKSKWYVNWLHIPRKVDIFSKEFLIKTFNNETHRFDWNAVNLWFKKAQRALTNIIIDREFSVLWQQINWNRLLCSLWIFWTQVFANAKKIVKIPV